MKCIDYRLNFGLKREINKIGYQSEEDKPTQPRMGMFLDW